MRARAASLGAIAVLAAVAAYQAARRARRYELRGRTVLVTGGSRGLGLVLARQLAEVGAKVAICARDEDTLERARQDLERHGRLVLALRCDVTVPDEVERLVRQVGERLGPVDVLVNNAGTISVGPVELMGRDDFRSAMDVNFWGPLNVILAVLPEMRRRGDGAILNIASIGGKLGVPHLVPYSASKFALVGLSEGLRAELGRDGIRVTTICPGLMRTGSPRHAWFKGRPRAEYAWFSISDALPIVSMDAERAAAQIVAALRRGEAGRTLSLPARVAAVAHGLFPSVTADALALVNRLLPGVGADPVRVPVKGEASTSFVSPSLLTRLSERAAVRNNQTHDPPA